MPRWGVAAVAAVLLAHGWLAAEDWRGQLRGRRVVITGASQGIGEQLAYQHCAAGASVLLVARSAPRLATVAEECRRRAAAQRGGIAVATLSTDLSEVEGCVRATPRPRPAPALPPPCPPLIPTVGMPVRAPRCSARRVSSSAAWTL